MRWSLFRWNAALCRKARIFSAFSLAFLVVGSSLAFEGNNWIERKEATGTIFFDCRVDVCGGREATLSYRTRSDLAELNGLVFLRGQHEFERSLLTNPRMGMRSVDGLDTGEEKLEDHDLFWRSRVQVRNAGDTTFYITAYLRKGADGMSVVTSAPSREAAQRNFRAFLPTALKILRAAKP
jgi:hypothetical protein